MRVVSRVPQVAALILVTSCGTIFNGTRQNVSVITAPDRARVQVDPGGQTFTTPTTLDLERKNDYTLRFSKEGYSPAESHISKSMNGGILVLDILAGLLGVIVDAVTGGWYNLDPKSANVVLTKADVDAPGPAEIRINMTAKGRHLRIESSSPGVSVGVERR